MSINDETKRKSCGFYTYVHVYIYICAEDAFPIDNHEESMSFVQEKYLWTFCIYMIIFMEKKREREKEVKCET